MNAKSQLRSFIKPRWRWIAAGAGVIALVIAAWVVDRINAPPEIKTHTEMINGVALELVWIPAGSFMMGSTAEEVGRYDWEGPQHRVELDGFWMGEYEITQEQYAAVMGTNPSAFKGDGRRPVESVSWYDAAEFCKKLEEMTGKAFRLPTEAEWEYACRAGTTTPYSTGEKLWPNQANFAAEPSRFQRLMMKIDSMIGTGLAQKHGTAPAGSFSPNDWGLYDMHGNVWEWCSDRFGEYYYGTSPRKNPAGPDYVSPRVLRGGSWYNFPSLCRAAYRTYYEPDSGFAFYGFRLSWTP